MKPVTLTPGNPKTYRPDIDGLRAVAVLSVLFFHFGVDSFSGGFIGVDVFFVISGFLITRLIIDATDNQSFTFGGFYLRRARRLLPALLFTILGSFIVGCVIFSPQHLQRLGGSALHGILSISNFFFWSESGYFDADAKVKPLLHLWSLSVEEQFYFIWPLTLVLLQKASLSRITTPLTFLLLGVASWAFAEWFLQSDPSGAFYLLPSRIVEFCMGAMMVWLVGISARPWIREVALMSGLILIGYAAISFTKQTPFPGTNALIPCLGTSLAIFGGSSRLVGALLRSTPMVFTGLISYSLYLCHWPIYVFYLYVTDSDQLGPLQIVGLTFLSFVVATLMYRFVERPFRFTKPGPQAVLASTRFALGCSLIALVAAYLAASSWANGGWYWRFGNSKELAEIFDLDRLQIETMDYGGKHLHGAAFPQDNKRILVVGDSHALSVGMGLHQSLANRGFVVGTMQLDDTCLEQISSDGQLAADAHSDSRYNCPQDINTYVKSLKAPQADLIVYSVDWSVETSKFVGRFVKLAQKVSKNKNVKIVVMDRAVHFGNLHADAIGAYARGVSPAEINAYALNADKDPIVSDQIESALSEADVLDDVIFVSKRHIQCGESACDFFTEDGELAIWDFSHWTLKGSKLFMSRFIDENPSLFQ
jgi:peptidoglycan/LPS O-acetylase OafA/YrhL